MKISSCLLFYVLICLCLILGSCDQWCSELCDGFLGQKQQDVRSFDLISGCGVVDLGSFATKELPSTTFYQFASQRNTFTLPSDVISFAIYLLGDPSETLGFEALIDPLGTNVVGANTILEYISLPIRPRFRRRYNGLVIPSVPTLTATPGEWQFQIGTLQSNPVQVKLLVRTGKTPPQTVLKIQPFLTGTRFQREDLTAAFNEVIKIYQKIGVTVLIGTATKMTDTRFTVVDPDFENSTTAELIQQGFQQRINLFLAEDLIGEIGSPLGIASTIPSPQGLKDPFNGVLVNLDGHLVGNKLDSKLLGETMVHEIGHWMGLYHSTEKDGRNFDPIEDSPECSVTTQDADHNASVTPDECLSFGSTNVMFWAGSIGLEQTVLTPGQAHVIAYSPIACDE